MISFPYLPLVVIALAVLPALVVWSQGRRLVRHAAEDDAVLAERMAGAQRRTGYVLFATTLVLILLAPRHAVWSLLLMLLLTQVADYPARRKIHGETWTLPAYLSFSLRSMVALSGFWALLALTPWLVHHAGAAALPAALVLAAVLTVWLVRFPQVLLALFHARRLDRPSLEPALAGVIAKASVPMPRLWRSDPRGGLVPAAFALPSLRGGGVLFLQPLLDRLSEDEIIAIFAHEVAHLEQFTRRVLRRGLAAGVVLILFGVCLAPVLRSVAPEWTGSALVVWPLVVLVGVRFRARAHQPLEIAGDRRAAELCGHPEALASALIRLYALTRMPRRLDVDVERWASHPSLARRVQALRRLTGAAGPAAAHEPVSVVAADGRTLVTFDADGVRVAPAVAAASTPAAAEPGAGAELLAYADLHELRIEFRGRQPHLIVRDRSGRVQHVPLREADAPGVHTVLDRIDGRLAPDMPRPSRVRRGALAAAAASVVAVFSPLSLLSVFVVAGVASFGASRLTLTAAAAASLTGAIWAGWTATGPAAAVTALALGALGLVLGWSAARERDVGLSRLQRAMAVVALLVLMAGTAVAWTLGFLAEGASAWRLHQAAVTWPGTIVFPLALAAALAVHGGPARRAFAVAPAVLAAVALFAASGWFVDLAVRDPLIAPAPRLDAVVARVHGRQRLDVPDGGAFELSPGGRWILRHSDDEGSEVKRFILRSVGGTTFVIEGSDVAFVDDEHVAVAIQGESSIDVIARRLDPGLPEVWRIGLPKVFVMEIQISPGDPRWRVTGWGSRGEAVRFDGRVGETHWVERRWPVPSHAPGGMWFVGSGPEALWLARPMQAPSWRMQLSVLTAGRHVPDYGADRVMLVGTGGDVRTVASELRLNCLSPPIGQNAVACAAFDGRDTRMYRVGREIAPVAIVPGPMWLMHDHADGTLTAIAGASHVLLQPDADRIVRFERESSPWLEMSYAGPRVAFTTISQVGEVLEVGRLDIP